MLSLPLQNRLSCEVASHMRAGCRACPCRLQETYVHTALAQKLDMTRQHIGGFRVPCVSPSLSCCFFSISLLPPLPPSLYSFLFTLKKMLAKDGKPESKTQNTAAKSSIRHPSTVVIVYPLEQDRKIMHKAAEPRRLWLFWGAVAALRDGKASFKKKKTFAEGENV